MTRVRFIHQICHPGITQVIQDCVITGVARVITVTRVRHGGSICRLGAKESYLTLVRVADRILQLRGDKLNIYQNYFIYFWFET